MKKILILLLLSLGLIGATSAGEVETNILKLKALNACESCNLRGADLSDAYLTTMINVDKEVSFQFDRHDQKE